MAIQGLGPRSAAQAQRIRQPRSLQEAADGIRSALAGKVASEVKVDMMNERVLVRFASRDGKKVLKALGALLTRGSLMPGSNPQNALHYRYTFGNFDVALSPWQSVHAAVIR